ncbi:MAG: MotE family protein [Fimbriimonadaceae bacterium]
MGNKLIFIIVGIVLLVGAVIGLGVAGIVPIPGLSPANKTQAKKDDPKAADPKADAAKTLGPATPTAPVATKPIKPPDPAPAAAPPKLDLDKGYTKLAAVWGEIDPKKLADILLTQYRPEAAAPILKRMDEDKVAAVISSMQKPKDAAAYSDAIAKEASKVPPAPTP